LTKFELSGAKKGQVSDLRFTPRKRAFDDQPPLPTSLESSVGTPHKRPRIARRSRSSPHLDTKSLVSLFSSGQPAFGALLAWLLHGHVPRREPMHIHNQSVNLYGPTSTPPRRLPRNRPSRSAGDWRGRPRASARSPILSRASCLSRRSRLPPRRRAWTTFPCVSAGMRPRVCLYESDHCVCVEFRGSAYWMRDFGKE
jgi:hypothetical protein